MQFKLNTKEKLSTKVKGLFSAPIQYEDRLGNKKWSDYFGKYQNQRWGLWDSSSCWYLSMINVFEDQLEYLWKNGMFSADAIRFFIENKYIDEDGDFSLSERFGEILGGNRDNGGTALQAWQLTQKYGFIPRSQLTYTLEQSRKFSNQKDFNNDYFNKSAITPAMMTLGKQSLSYVSIAVQRIGKAWYTPVLPLLKASLKQAPLQIGIPIPKDVWKWNNPTVAYDGGFTPSHEVELYDIADDGSYLIFDQYIPNLKKLSKDYYLPIVTQGIVTAINPIIGNPIVQDSYWQTFWTAVNNWYNNIFDNKVPIGGELNANKK